MKETNGPPCGCTLDGFKKLSIEKKYKTFLCHYAVSDHTSLNWCIKCGLVSIQSFLLIHIHFDCDDEKMKRTYANNPTLDIFKELNNPHKYKASQIP